MCVCVCVRILYVGRAREPEQRAPLGPGELAGGTSRDAAHERVLLGRGAGSSPLVRRCALAACIRTRFGPSRALRRDHGRMLALLSRVSSADLTRVYSPVGLPYVRTVRETGDSRRARAIHGGPRRPGKNFHGAEQEDAPADHPAGYTQDVSSHNAELP